MRRPHWSLPPLSSGTEPLSSSQEGWYWRVRLTRSLPELWMLADLTMQAVSSRQQPLLMVEEDLIAQRWLSVLNSKQAQK